MRLYDSRSASGRLSYLRQLLGTPVAGELAFLLNVTITDTLGTGWLSIYSADDTWPGTPTINWFGPNQTLANNAYTKFRLADNGLSIKCGGGGSTQFVLDLVGVLVLFDLAAFNPASFSAADTAASASAGGRTLRESAAG